MRQNNFRRVDALLIIDVQNDFLPGGALAVENGGDILAVLNTRIERSCETRTPVYASRDWPTRDHVSFEEAGGRWPPHCVQDSKGAAIPPELKLPAETTLITKGVRFDRDQNSVFADAGLATHLQDRHIRRLFAGVLALDICMLKSIMDAVAAGLEVVRTTEATRPMSAKNISTTIEQMRGAGVALINAAVLDDPSGQKPATPTESDVYNKAP